MDNEKTIQKEFKNLFGIKWGKILGSIFIIFLFVVIYIKGHADGGVSITNNMPANPQTKGTETSTNPNPVNFPDDIQNWNYNGYTINNSVVCPAVFKNYYPIIWYNLPISMIFKIFSFTYTYPYDNNSPAYVIAIGKNNELLRLYLHEQSSQLIGVSVNQLDQNNIPKFGRIDPLTLSEVPFGGSEITITINPVQAGNSGITYNLNVIYTPKNRPKDKTDDPFTITSMYFGDIPQAQTEIGFGTSVNNCITPLRYVLVQ